MIRLAALACGLLCGFGLMVAGMTDPAKVLAFLDVAGAWDPSLALVMAAAASMALVGFRVAGRLARPLLGGKADLPATRGIDPSLVAGSVLFGVGWGLVGFCPGPALVALGMFSGDAAIFLVAALLGKVLHDLVIPQAGGGPMLRFRGQG